MKHLNTLKSFIAGTALAAGFAVAFASCSSVKSDFNNGVAQGLRDRKVDASRIAVGDGVRLSEAIDKNLRQDQPNEARTKLLKFIAHAQSAKSSKNRAQSFQECQTKFSNAPECVFLKPSWSDNWFVDDSGTDDDSADDTEVALKITDRKNAAHEKKLSKRERSKALNHLIANLKEGSLEKVTNQREGDYYRAFKKFSSWSPNLEQLAKKLIDQKECADSELYNYLGLKAEEYFPNPELLKSAVSLYSKADECGQQSSAANTGKYLQNARFRLGLLAVLQNDCNEAKQVFSRLSKMGTGDFSTRALYWSAYCSKSDSNKDQFLASFDELFKSNPLGFHTLSINHGDSLLIENLSKPIDPIVRTRTAIDEQYNVWLSVIEDFDRMKETNGVYKLLAPVRKSPEYLATLEPGVRLYLSTFAYRSHDMISLFRILDSVFRTQSEYVVDSTLKLFYPMKHFDSIVSQVKHVHPFLITALIRQESAFQEGAKSKVGAVGLMQLMPRTARLMDRSMTKSRLLQPENNLRVGIKFFESLVNRYQGDVELALAAYNAGPEVVDRWVKRYSMKNRLLFLDLIPYAETRNYVTLIGRNYYWYSKIYADQLKTGNGIAQILPNEFQSLKSQ
jgi:hypothetical protein